MDMRLWTAPHLTAELTSVDYRTNADPAMKAILNYSPKETLSELLGEALAKDDLDLAVKRYRAFMADPIHKYCYTEEILWNAGSRLLRANKPRQAIVIFELNTEANPWSPWAHAALGEAYQKNGNREPAIESFERSLKRYPQNPDLIENLKQLRQQ
jgi:tetratricopeptide (TPR) repeat protein